MLWTLLCQFVFPQISLNTRPEYQVSKIPSKLFDKFFPGESNQVIKTLKMGEGEITMDLGGDHIPKGGRGRNHWGSRPAWGEITRDFAPGERNPQEGEIPVTPEHDCMCISVCLSSFAYLSFCIKWYKITTNVPVDQVIFYILNVSNEILIIIYKV